MPAAKKFRIIAFLKPITNIGGHHIQVSHLLLNGNTGKQSVIPVVEPGTNHPEKQSLRPLLEAINDK